MVRERTYLPVVGDHLWAKHKGEIYESDVIQTEDGIRIKLNDVELSGQDHQDGATLYHLVRKAPGKSLEYKGLSRAGGAITGWAVTIGSFWHVGLPTDVKVVEPIEKPAKVEKPKAEAKVKAEKPAKEPKAPKAEKPKAPAKATPVFHLVADQSNAPEGQALWWCNACAEGFYFPAGLTPTECHNHHTQESIDALVHGVEGVPAEEAPAAVVEDAPVAEAPANESTDAVATEPTAEESTEVREATEEEAAAAVETNPAQEPEAAAPVS